MVWKMKPYTRTKLPPLWESKQPKEVDGNFKCQHYLIVMKAQCHNIAQDFLPPVSLAVSVSYGNQSGSILSKDRRLGRENDQCELKVGWLQVVGVFSRLSVMKRLAYYLMVIGVWGLGGVGTAQAALITNGDFSANAASFVTDPGYTSWGLNPATITGWNTLGGQFGINGSDTASTAFGPTDQSAVGNYAFIQGFGGLSQDLSLTPGQEYQVNFSAAARSVFGSTLARIQIVDTPGLIPYGSSGDFAPSSAAFVASSFTFTAPLTHTGSLMIQLYNLDSGDGNARAAVFSNLVMTAIPEPTSAMLLLMGSGLAILISRRKRL